jgi:prevent-host-death family protein
MIKNTNRIKYKEITSTELKQNMRKTINSVNEQGIPYLITTYDEPKVVMVDYDEWKKLLDIALQNNSSKGNKSIIIEKTKGYKKSAFSKIKHLIGTYPEMKDSVKFFREMRDAEGV